MILNMLKCKIHRATVTGADLTYEGSISICTDLIQAAGLLLNEKVEIYNCNNGERFSTYVIPGQPGEIGLNGAAARLVMPGDIVIICAYLFVEETQAPQHKPTVIFVNEKNQQTLT
jgi:aspartate 1-decarboxylase